MFVRRGIFSGDAITQERAHAAELFEPRLILDERDLRGGELVRAANQFVGDGALIERLRY